MPSRSAAFDRLPLARASARTTSRRSALSRASLRLSGSFSVPSVERPHVAQAYLLHEFYQALTEGRRPATTCQDNIRSLGLVFDTVTSFESGQVVRCAVC